MSKQIVVMAGLATLATALAGCGTSPRTAANTATLTTATVALPVQTAPNWFFPVLASTGFTDTNSQMNFLMYKPLVYITKSDGVDYHRSIAASITPNAQGTRYLITLNSRYRWSNGQPVTAQDVVFTWNVMKAASGSGNTPWTYGGAGGGGVPKDWQSVTAQGSNKVAVVLSKPVNPVWFIHNGLAQLIPVPALAWNKHPHNMMKELAFIKSVANQPTNPVFNVVDGPYHFSQMQANNFWSFVPNTRYGGHASAIKKLIFQYETSSAAEFSALKTGTIDVGYLPPSLWGSRSALTHDQFWPAYLFGFNMARLNQSPLAPNGLGPVFSQQYVRAALEMGINQKGIINGIYHGQGVIENNPVPSKPLTQFYDSALAKSPYAFNPTAGKNLLEKHGWRLVNGVMTKNGVKLSFTFYYTSGSGAIQHTMELIKQNFAQEGVNIQLQPATYDNVITIMHSNPAKWNAAYWGSGWTYQPDYYPTGGELFATGAAANAGHYSSRTMDKLIAATYEPGSSRQIRQNLFNYEAWARHDVPYLWYPWIPAFNENLTALGQVQATFNPITALFSPNRWTLQKGN